MIDNDGTPLTSTALRSKFDTARENAGNQKWQLRDLRAKAGTDKDMAEGIRASQDLLGHRTETRTADYIRHRIGKRTTPTK
ncbi:integrase [Chitinimonas arctica]|uniref:integrase n=1 Tax=Chitinimonas arctica TaxID=2594795 RepID=UPI001CC59F59|nr:integrase [Chitinimonas arctica]